MPLDGKFKANTTAWRQCVAKYHRIELAEAERVLCIAMSGTLCCPGEGLMKRRGILPFVECLALEVETTAMAWSERNPDKFISLPASKE